MPTIKEFQSPRDLSLHGVIGPTAGNALGGNPIPSVYIVRDLFFDKQASIGTCFVYKNEEQLFKSESLERGWTDNERGTSCIPIGTYDLVLEYSPRFKTDLWEVKGVPNRSECKFHAANYFWQLNGCIALGSNRKRIDGDLVMDVTNSRNTLKEFHLALEGEKWARLHVVNILQL